MWSATSSPLTALTWLAKPSRECAGWITLQIQSIVPGFWFSATSHDAVGTVTPLVSAVCCTAGTVVVVLGAGVLARAGGRARAPCVGPRDGPAQAPRVSPVAPAAAIWRKRRRSIEGPAPPSEGGCLTAPV